MLASPRQQRIANCNPQDGEQSHPQDEYQDEVYYYTASPVVQQEAMLKNTAATSEPFQEHQWKHYPCLRPVPSPWEETFGKHPRLLHQYKEGEHSADGVDHGHGEEVPVGVVRPVLAMCCTIVSLNTQWPHCFGIQCSGTGAPWEICLNGGCCCHTKCTCCKLTLGEVAAGVKNSLMICDKCEHIVIEPYTCWMMKYQVCCLDARASLPCVAEVPCMLNCAGMTCCFEFKPNFGFMKRVDELEPRFKDDPYTGGKKELFGTDNLKQVAMGQKALADDVVGGNYMPTGRTTGGTVGDQARETVGSFVNKDTAQQRLTEQLVPEQAPEGLRGLSVGGYKIGGDGPDEGQGEGEGEGGVKE